MNVIQSLRKIIDIISRQKKQKKKKSTSGSYKTYTIRTRNAANLILDLDKTFDGTSEIINKFNKHGILNDNILHYVFDAMFAKRRIDGLTTTISDLDFDKSTVTLFHLTRVDVYRGKPTLSTAQLWEAVTLSENDHFLARGLRDNIVRISVRDGRSDILVSVTNDFDPKVVCDFAPLTVQGVVNHLIAIERTADAEKIIATAVELSPSNEFVFYEHAQKLKIPVTSAGKSWLDMYERFMEIYPWGNESDREVVQKFVVEPTAKLPLNEHTDYTQIRIDESKAKKLLGLFKHKLEALAPLSMIRLGDGESYAYDPSQLPGTTPDQYADDSALRERVWWSSNISPDHRNRIAEGVRGAVSRADVLGIPSPYRLFRDVNRGGRAYGSATSQRGLSTVLSQIGNAIPVEGKIITEDRANQLIFNRDTIESLCEAAIKVVFVGCWNKDQLKFKSQAPVTYIVISAHSRVSGETDLAPPIYDTYETITAEIRSLCSPGTLAIVSAGLIGKIFIDAARQAGAVAIDVGAVSDYIAGYKTRHVADMI